MKNPEFNRILSEVPECRLMVLDLVLDSSGKPPGEDGKAMTQPERNKILDAQAEIHQYTRSTRRMRSALRAIITRPE